MGSIKLKGTLPKDDELNGLGGDAIADAFLADPRKPRIAIVVLQAETETKNFANGTVQPGLRINRIELIEDADEATNLLGRAKALSEQRTGSTPLPVKEFERGGADVLDFSEPRRGKGGEGA